MYVALIRTCFINTTYRWDSKWIAELDKRKKKAQEQARAGAGGTERSFESGAP